MNFYQHLTMIIMIKIKIMKITKIIMKKLQRKMRMKQKIKKVKN